ncbi:hypothetical protein D3C87_1379610 [compost metagenome]
MLHFIDVFGQQTLGQRQDVGGTLAQRAPGQGEHRQTIVKILAEAPRRHLTREVAIGGGDHTNVQCDRFARPNPFDLALLQHTQQFGLEPQGHFGNFIEQNGAAVGLLELAGLRGNGAGEGALLVPEQSRFEHVVRDRCAVDRNERLTGAMGMLVDVTRQHFLARARLARDQHRGIAARDPRRQLE